MGPSSYLACTPYPGSCGPLTCLFPGSEAFRGGLGRSTEDRDGMGPPGLMEAWTTVRERLPCSGAAAKSPLMLIHSFHKKHLWISIEIRTQNLETFGSNLWLN